MKTNNNQSTQTTESKIRRLFGRKIESAEHLLCFGSGYFGKTFRRALIIAITATIAALIIITLAIISILIDPRLDIAVFMSIATLFVAEPIVGLFFPRYYIVTTKQIGVCSHGIFGYNMFDFTDYSNISCISADDGVISIFLKDDSAAMKLHIADIYELERAADEISRILGEREWHN